MIKIIKDKFIKKNRINWLKKIIKNKDSYERLIDFYIHKKKLFLLFHFNAIDYRLVKNLRERIVLKKQF